MITKIAAVLRISLIGYILVAGAPVMAEQAEENYSDESDRLRVELVEKGFTPSREFPLIYMPPADNAEQATAELEALVDQIVDSL